ncbi:alpha/beta hydrolase family protein [Deinococcus wulumuqiensis]|uniref:alpha/beta hydrolase family protein n=1 Tax=Deinococcus wulumuqiensis TaxID=980427 RepID=UPI0004B7E226|nr:alpha/beta fold hydrolase [Deinococcus wulumuqiensis]
MRTSRSLQLFVLGLVLVLVGGLLAAWTQSSGGQVRIRDVRFTGANGQQLSALLYVPGGVSAEKPAPGILAVHGYINSREVQSDFALEFARRGYVVLSLDQAGHGFSDAPAFVSGYGGPAGLAYLRGLDLVDKNNIGLEGHSMGGWTVLSAAAAYPDGYKAMVLEGSSTGSGRAPEGTLTYPRNLALVFSQYDEFSQLMWDVPRAKDVTSSPKLQKVFGTTETVQPGKVYGDPAAGTARVLYTPATTHPGDHLSHEAIGHALDWFGRTLTGGTPLPASNQVWHWNEVGTTLGWLGFIALVLGTGGLLLHTRSFEGLRRAPSAPRGLTGAGWWFSALVMLALPIATFFPLFRWAGNVLKPSALWPQSITNQIMVWALVNTLVSLMLYLIWRAGAGRRAQAVTAPTTPPDLAVAVDTAGAPLATAPAPRRGNEVLGALAVALGAVGVGYLSLLLTNFLFKVDYRFWFVGLKPMTPTHLRMFLAYLIPFTLYALMTATVLHNQMRRHARGSMLTNALLLAGGFLLFLAVQYGTLLTRGQLFTPGEPLNVIVAIQFLPILAILGVFMTYFARRTDRPYLGAFVSALFLTWYIVAGQATQFPL